MKIRDELYHPLVAHYPIVLLTIAPLLFLCFLFGPKKWKEHCLVGFRLSLYTGISSFGLTIFLGDMAAEVERSKLADLVTLYQHEEMAYYSLYAFLLAMVFDLVSYSKLKRLSYILTPIALGTGVYYLVMTGHLGAQLVYEQGAGVQTP